MNQNTDVIEDAINQKAKIAVVLYIDAVSTCKTMLESIEKEKSFAKHNIQVILLDGICSDQSIKEITKHIEKFERDYELVECKNMGVAKAFNAAIPVIRADYVCFARTMWQYDEGALDEVISAVDKKAKIISLHPIYLQPNTELPMPYIPKSENYSGRYPVVDLNNFNSQQDFVSTPGSCFFKRELVWENCFDEEIPDDCDTKFLMMNLKKIGKYMLLLKKNITLLDPSEADYYNFPLQYDKEWYFDCLEKFLIPMSEEENPLFMQFALTYYLQCRFACNIDSRDAEVLNNEEYNHFLELAHRVLKNIDDRVAITVSIGGRKRLPNFMKLTCLRIKYGDPTLFPTIISSDRNLVTRMNSVILNSLMQESIRIKVTYFDGENLCIDGSFDGGLYYDRSKVKIMACIDGKFVDVRHNDVYGYKKIFDHPILKSIDFQFTWKSKPIKKKVRFGFYLIYEGRAYQIKCAFTRDQAKLDTKYCQNYWIFDHKMLSYDKTSMMFTISNYTKKEIFIRELKLMKDFHTIGDPENRWKAIRLRTLYWLTKPFYRKKKIWLTQDKLFKGGDNGEYFFRHVRKVQPNDIDIYYVLNEKAPEFQDRKKEFGKYLVKQNSLRHQLLALNTDMFLATHVDVMLCNGFESNFRQYFRSLFNGRVACLAHGLTIQKIAQYQNRVFDNTVLYFFASKYEVKNVSHPIYDYYDKNALKLTGHARYDGLKNNDQKIILITPTWRRSVTTGHAEKGSTYGYSENFKHSTYYHIYNNLIHDEKITESAKKNGYKIVYLLHPAMSPQLRDYESTDVCQVVAATSDISYEKILTESSLMITDYSGVQFDFAYMKKPLIYYHPDELPAQYDASGLVYETMGFGPICKNHDQVVQELCEYMDQQCVMKDEYKTRVDDFFEYDDYNNCERIYKEVVDFQSKFEKINTL